MAKKKKVVKEITGLDLVRKAVVKKYGVGVIGYLGEREDEKIEVISSGCLSLDSALGIGGLALGRLYEIYGPQSAGKSTLALSVCMQALKKDLNVIYIDAEHSLSLQLVKDMGKAIGVNVDKLDLITAFIGDDNLEIAEKLMKTGEIDVLVVDSVSSLLPKAMHEGDIGDNYIGLLARLMSKACLKLSPLSAETNTLVIFINQTRVDINKWGDKHVPTGGTALPFYASGRIKVEGGEAKSSLLIDDNGVINGHVCKITVVKNKLSVPHKIAGVDLIYGVGYDFVSEVVGLSIDLGIIDQSGAWFTYGEERYQGKSSLVKVFRENNELYNELRSKVKEMLGLFGE